MTFRTIKMETATGETKEYVVENGTTICLRDVVEELSITSYSEEYTSQDGEVYDIDDDITVDSDLTLTPYVEQAIEELGEEIVVKLSAIPGGVKEFKVRQNANFQLGTAFQNVGIDLSNMNISDMSGDTFSSSDTVTAREGLHFVAKKMIKGN